MPQPLRPRHLLLLPLLVVALFVGNSCHISMATFARPSAVTGCDMVRARDGGLRCQLSAATATHEVVLWFEGEHLIESKVELRTAWRRTSPRVEVRFLDTGTRLVAHVEGEGLLEVSGIVDDPGAEHVVRRRWAVPLELRPDDPELDAIEQRWHTHTWAAPTDAYEILDDLHRFAALAPPWQAAKAWRLRGEILQRTASPLDALGAYERAVELAGADELTLRCGLQRRIAELYLVDLERHLAAERILDDMVGCEALGLAHHAPRAYLLGLLAFRRTDLEEAIAELRRALGGSEQVGLPRVGLAAAALLAHAEARVQRFEAAETALRQARELSRGLDLDCEDELALAGHAAAVTALQPLERGPGNPTALVLLDALRAECRASGTVESLTVLNLAYALQRWGRNDEAQRWLERLDRAALPPQQRMFVASIAADVAMALGDWPGAARAAQTLASLLDRHPHEASVELVVQRELVLGRVAKARHDLAAARRHLQRAIDRQDEQLRLVPLGLASSRVSATLADPARYLVELELEQGQTQAALCTARLLRNRSGRALMDAALLRGQGHERYHGLVAEVTAKELAFEEAERTGSLASLARAKAQLEAAQRTLLLALHGARGLADPTPESLCKSLRAPAAHELALLLHQDPQGRWWLFEWSRDEPVRIHDLGLGNPLPTDDPQRLVERFLHPARDRLGRASAVRLLTSGATHALRFEALPWDEGTFEQAFEITWALDLPSRSGQRRRRQAALQPVVVYTDLYNEFHRVDPQVKALFATIERVWGAAVPKLVDASASTRDLQHLSAGAAPLVVIGHNSALAELDVDNPKCGEPRAPGPSRPQNPGLVTAPDRPTPGLWINQTSMGLATLLTLEPPRVAILESCATGPTDELALDGAVGLGHALVAAGAEQVLATRRMVCPEQALGFLQAVVEASGREPLELPRLLRAARSKDPDYLHRVLVP